MVNVTPIEQESVHDGRAWTNARPLSTLEHETLCDLMAGYHLSHKSHELPPLARHEERFLCSCGHRCNLQEGVLRDAVRKRAL